MVSSRTAATRSASALSDGSHRKMILFGMVPYIQCMSHAWKPAHAALLRWECALSETRPRWRRAFLLATILSAWG